MNTMTEEYEGPHILFEQHGDGFLLKFGGWEKVLEKGYMSFEGIRKTFQTSNDVVPDLMAQEGEGDEDREYIRVINPPEPLLDNPDWQIAILGRLYNYLAEVGLYHIAMEELETQYGLLEREQFKTLLVRQSAFFEDFLRVLCQTHFQAYANRVLSNKEMKLIAQMGHQDRTRIAYLLGAITEKEHGHLQEMVSARNTITHNSWTEFDEADEQRYESVSKKVNGVLEDYLDRIDQGEGPPVIDLPPLPEDYDSDQST